MLKKLNGNQKNFQKKLETILNTRKSVQKNKSNIIKPIIKNVKKNGDKAIIRYEKKFSTFRIKNDNLKFSQKEINKIASSLDSSLKKSIDLAFKRIKNFHIKQKNLPFKLKINIKMNYPIPIHQLNVLEFMCQEGLLVILARY